ncbi:MAG: hypothetical protein J6T39_01190 [Clostridia bacterium]|nr:hypothetical protein [Clostridia bacterium]
MIENKEYTCLQDLIDDVNNLGDWRDPEGIKDYLKVLSKVNNIYSGYSIETLTPEGLIGKLEGDFPSVVREAIVEVLKTKFPTEAEVFDKTTNLMFPGLPNHANYLPLATSTLGLSVLHERTRIDEIANFELDFGWSSKYHKKQNVLNIIESSKKFMEKIEKKHANDVEEKTE